MQAIETLAQQPDRCPHAPETDLLPTGLRELHFRSGRKITHRILFTVLSNNVRILRIRHAAQQYLTLDDLI
jgi:plasmid stabilization system protein ParE